MFVQQDLVLQMDTSSVTPHRMGLFIKFRFYLSRSHFRHSEICSEMLMFLYDMITMTWMPEILHRYRDMKCLCECSRRPQIQLTGEQQQILSHDIQPGHVVKIIAFAGTVS